MFKKQQTVSFLLLFASTLAAQKPFQNGQAARAVLGQITFTKGDSIPSQRVLGGAGGVAWGAGKLWVVDSNRIGSFPQDHRVIGFDTNAIPGRLEDITLNTTVAAQVNCFLCGNAGFITLGQDDYTPPTWTPAGQSVTTAFFSGRNGGQDPPGTSKPEHAWMYNPTAVATDNQRLVVADTDNNRVLIWTTIPAGNNQPPNLVLGQPDFATVQQQQLGVVSATTMRGPQGVWIANGRLYVADTQNHRVLIWNTFPTQNNQTPDVVLGQADFTHAVAPAPSKTPPVAAANRLLNPVGVTADNSHVFVADLGFNRIMIWNTASPGIFQNADVVIGQTDFMGSKANNSTVCPNQPTTATTITNVPCAQGINFPRFALSDGKRLFVADGGNDRVLIFNTVPTANAAAADNVLGQTAFDKDIVTSQGQGTFSLSTQIDNTGSVDTTPTPTALAYDGTNLYVADSYNRRVLIFTPGDSLIPSATDPNATVVPVVNWASEIVRQEGTVALAVVSGGKITANDTVTITIQSKAYTYTLKDTDTIDGIARALVKLINGAPDANATATFAGIGSGSIYLSSVQANLDFDSITLAASVSNAANLVAGTSGAYLTAGNAATASPGALIEVNAPTGVTFIDTPTVITAAKGGRIPNSLGGVQVYLDGIASPLYKVSQTQIVAQIPPSFTDRNSTSVYVRTVHGNGSVTVTNATPVYIAPANPGIFNAPAFAGQPRPWPIAQAFHQAKPSSVVSVDGSVHTGDTLTITIQGTAYTYTVLSTDTTLALVVTGLVNAINNGNDPYVTASAGGAFTRVVLTSRLDGLHGGSGITVATSTSASATETLTAYTAATCCAVQPNSMVYVGNPAAPGEMITIAAAGLGSVVDTSNNVISYDPALPYSGPVPNNVVNGNFVSGTMGGSTAQIIYSGLDTGTNGIYRVDLIVPSGLSSNDATSLYIAQNTFISNTVTVPVGTAVANPPPPPSATSQTIVFTAIPTQRAGTSLALNATASSGLAIAFATATASVCTVTGNTLTLVSSGICTVTASQAGNESYAATSTTQGFLVNASSGLPAALQFVAIAPCRIVDTRLANGAFGGPELSGNVSRDFFVPSSGCGIPSNAAAYSLNVTAVPDGPLGYLTIWPTGLSRPLVSTLNSDSRVKANAAVLLAGTNGGVSVFATQPTHLVLDISGYFIAGSSSGLDFYPVTPCRVADTRFANGALGTPVLSAGVARSFPVLSSPCGIPGTAQAYSLNFTAVPRGALGYLTTWPAGQARPLVSTLNSSFGGATANAAIVPAGAGGAVSVYASDDSDLVIDINGYFAPHASGGLAFYYLPPCRVLDTRDNTGAFSGTKATNVSSSSCSAPSSARAYVLNSTVVPSGPLQFLTLWPAGQTQPLVSTLNATDGVITSNMAIVPASAGSVNSFATSSTQLIFDISGYFAP